MVKNLAFAIDDNRHYEFFSSCGEVVSARVLINREDGRSRGFGFVDFSSPEGLAKVIRTEITRWERVIKEGKLRNE